MAVKWFFSSHCFLKLLNIKDKKHWIQLALNFCVKPRYGHCYAYFHFYGFSNCNFLFSFNFSTYGQNFKTHKLPADPYARLPCRPSLACVLLCLHTAYWPRPRRGITSHGTYSIIPGPPTITQQIHIFTTKFALICFRNTNSPPLSRSSHNAAISRYLLWLLQPATAI